MNDNNRLQQMFIDLNDYKQKAEYHSKELEKAQENFARLSGEVLSEPALNDALMVGITHADVTYKKSDDGKHLIVEKYQQPVFIHQLNEKA